MITFAHPWFLLALPLALGPTLLHLLSRRKLKQVEFSSLFFLRRMRERRFRWLKLRDLVLLLLRTFFLLAILLALAGPSLKTGMQLGRTRADMVIILDDSYSTSARFDKLRNTALRLARELSPDSRVALITPSASSWDTVWSDPQSLVSRLETTGVSGTGRNLEGAWRAAMSLLEHKSERLRRLVIITDGQERAVDFLVKERIPEGVEVLCFLDDKPAPENASILDASLAPEFPYPGEPQVLKVRISRAGKKDDVRLSVNSDDQGVREQHIIIGGQGGGGAEKIVNFPLTQSPGNLNVFLDWDSIPADNERFLHAASGGAFRVALVGKADSDMLQLALKAQGVLDVTEVSPQFVSTLSAGSCDLIIWDGAAGLPAQAYEAARKGLPVLVLLESDAEPVSGVYKSTDKASRAGFEIIKPSSFFSAVEEKDLSQVKIFDYAAVQPQGVQVMVFLGSGEPLVMKDTSLNITYVTSRFTPSHTDMVYMGLYPSILKRIMVYAKGGGLERSCYIGDTISVKLGRPDPVRVETPSVQYEIIPLPTNQGYEARFTATGEAGFYKIGHEEFVVNPDPGEASSIRVRSPELKKAGIGVYALETSAPKSLILVLLILAALALALEFILVLV